MIFFLFLIFIFYKAFFSLSKFPISHLLGITARFKEFFVSLPLCPFFESPVPLNKGGKELGQILSNLSYDHLDYQITIPLSTFQAVETNIEPLLYHVSDSRTSFGQIIFLQN